MDGIIFTHYRRSPSTKRVNSTRSAARNQLFPEAKMQTGSSAARSVQLSGSSHWRPFLSRKQTLCSPLYSLHARASNSWPESGRSEEHTSELQSRGHLVCRLLLEKKKKKKKKSTTKTDKRKRDI